MSKTNELSKDTQIKQLEYQLRCVVFNIKKAREAIIASGKGGSRANSNFHGNNLRESRRSERTLTERITALQSGLAIN